MKSKLWNGGFLRTVLQGLTVTCAALLALSALGAGLTLGGVIGQQQLSAAAVVISFLGVFPGAWLTARHAAGQKPAAIVVGVCCLAVCMLARLLFFGNREAQILPGMLAMLAAAALGGIAGSTQRKPARRRRR